jgi:hypothetical protein
VFMSISLAVRRVPVATIHKVVEFFSGFTVLPIDPDDVADQIKSYGVKDEIEFVGVTLDVRIIRGALHHYVHHPAVYAEPVICAAIYIDRSQPREWRRLVAIKELLHLLDESTSQTATAGDCEKLLDDLVNIKDAASEFDVSALQAWQDLLMLYYAMAVAFPENARDILFEDYKAGHISLQDIQSRVDLPMQAVELVMSEGWPAICRRVTGRM